MVQDSAYGMLLGMLELRTCLSMHIETMVYKNNAYRKNDRMVDKKMIKAVT